MARSMAQEARKWIKTTDAVARRREGIVRYGTVETVSGSVANVRLESGQLVSNVNHAAGIATGTRVAVRGTGKQGGISWGVERVAKITTEQRSGDPNQIINTPSFARVATGLHAIVNGTPYFFLRIAIWQIREQYRDGQRVKYEVQLQKSVGADLAMTLTVAEHRQMGAALKVPLDDGDTGSTTIEPILSIPEDPAPEYHFDPYGAVDVQGEIIYHDGEGADMLVSLSRGKDTPEGVPTSDVDHDTGEFVLARTVMVETINLAANTAYRYRARAIIGDKTSNYSDWETVTTAYDTTVPGWSVTPTPTIDNITERLVATWTAVNVNVAHFMDYEVQYGSDITFATNTKTDYTRSTQYSFSYPISAQGYLRVRPRNTSFQVGSWSNTARFANGRDIARGRPLTNKVSNGDFPSNTTGWTASTGLTKNHDSSRGFVALGCLQFEFVRNGGHGGQVAISQSISGFTAGQYFHAVAYVCRESNFNQTLDEVYLEVQAGSDRYASPLIPFGSVPIKDTGDWLLLECNGQIPAATTSVTFRVYANVATSPAVVSFIYLDDCQLFITGSKT